MVKSQSHHAAELQNHLFSLLLFDLRKQVTTQPRHDARAAVLTLRLARLVFHAALVLSHHGEGFAAASLPIGEDGAVEPGPRMLQQPALVLRSF